MYSRSLAIEQRLSAVLRLIRTGPFSTPQLAAQLNVSVPTVSRCVQALRQRGHVIRAERDGDAWRYSIGRACRQSSDTGSARLADVAHSAEIACHG